MLFSMFSFGCRNFGAMSDVEPPFSIPNKEVKRISADGTWSLMARESRSVPRFLQLNTKISNIRCLIFLYGQIRMDLTKTAAVF